MTAAYVPEQVTIPTPQFSRGFELTRTRLDPDRYWQALDAGPTWLWSLRGPAGVIVFIAGQHLPDGGVCDLCRRYRAISVVVGGRCWKGWDVGRHSPRPIWPDETPVNDGVPCDLLGDRPCYYDGSGLQAERVLTGWLANGQSDDWLAGELREYYTHWLGER